MLLNLCAVLLVPTALAGCVGVFKMPFVSKQIALQHVFAPVEAHDPAADPLLHLRYRLLFFFQVWVLKFAPSPATNRLGNQRCQLEHRLKRRDPGGLLGLGHPTEHDLIGKTFVFGNTASAL